LNNLYSIDKAQGITYDVWEGRISAEICFSNIQKLLDDTSWPTAERKHMVDLRNITLDHTLDNAVIKKLIDYSVVYREKFYRLKVALIIDNVRFDFLSLQRVLMQHSVILIVFRSLEMACSWLEVDMDTAAQKLQHLREQLILVNAEPGHAVTDPGRVPDTSKMSKKHEQLKSEILRIIKKIKDPDLKHEEYIMLVERLDKVWAEFWKQSEKIRHHF
jgi:hypothetical protein